MWLTQTEKESATVRQSEEERQKKIQMGFHEAVPLKMYSLSIPGIHYLLLIPTLTINSCFFSIPFLTRAKDLLRNVHTTTIPFLTRAKDIHMTTMDYSPPINEYKENDSEVSSPIWIWFQKKEKNDVICQICKTNIQRRDSSNWAND